MQKTSNKKTNSARKRQSAINQLTLRRMLVPMDFSGYARQALDCAVPLARNHCARISLVHVVQPPTVSAWRGIPGGGHYLAMSTHQRVNIAQAHLEDLATNLLPEDVRGQTIVREGHAAFEVVAAAAASNANLIVLSNTGRSGLSRVAFGSTAECIVRHAHCPVLTVRRQRSDTNMRLLSPNAPEYPPRVLWRRILVPLDFSLTSLRALKVAVPLAQQYGARLFLLNIVEPDPFPVGMEGAILVIPERTLVQTARKHLHRIARKWVPMSVDTTCLIARGRAASLIVKTAAEKNADLIVLSTHGHTGFDRVLLGSTAEGVVRHATCPVLVARYARTRPAVWTRWKSSSRNRIRVPVETTQSNPPPL